MHADKTNRGATLVCALLLLAGGVLTAILGFGGFGSDLAQRTLTDNPVSAYVGEHGSWLWPVAAVVALLLLIAGLLWLRALFTSTDRIGEITVAGDRSRGRTVLDGSAVPAAVENEVGAYWGVDSASARFIGEIDDPTLVIAVTVNHDADLKAVRQRIQAEAIAHARQALERPALKAEVEIGFTRRSRERVR